MKQLKNYTLLLLILPLFCLGQWTQEGQDINGEFSGDTSGCSVSLNGQGNIIAVGAISNNGNKGHVRVFENISGTWTQIGQDIDGENGGDSSGYSVSLNNNGNIVAIGAINNDDAASLSGHVRVFENISGTWTQIGQDIDGEANQNQSGRALSLNASGNVVAIGAAGSDTNGVNSGHVKIFKNIIGVWTQIGQNINGELAGDASGSSLSLNALGNIIIIGAKGNDGNGNISGHARVYENISETWTQIGQDINGEAAGDQSGATVCINAQGNIIAIGAGGNDGNGSGAGHVRVFENQSNVWIQIGQDIDGENAGDFSGGGLFATAIDINAQGNIIAIGALENDGNGTDSGHVRIFENLSSVWTQVGQDIDGEAAGDKSGDAVSINASGNIIAIGAYSNDGNGVNSGHARIYTNSTLSIISNSFGSNFSIFPNPSNGISEIHLSSVYNQVTMNVFNFLGANVLTKKYKNTDKLILNMQKFNSGVYFIKIESNNKLATLKLIIK